MNEGSSVLAAAACGIEAHLIQRGVDPDSILGGFGIEPCQPRDETGQLDLAAYVALMELASRKTGDENFGLAFGREFAPERLGLIGRLALSAPRLVDALRAVAMFFPYHQQATETRWSMQGGLCRLEYRILDSRIVDRRQDAELTMGMFINIVRSALGSRWSPIEIECEHPQPGSWRSLESMFDAPFSFSRRTNAIVLRNVDLDRNMPQADPVAFAGYLDALRAVPGGTGRVTLCDRVKGEIRALLPDGRVTIGTVSESLGIARWTLQRQLESSGRSFSSLHDEARRELAPLYLRQQWLPATEIAFLLGYSELSAFTRAFKRWYGASPSDWREKL
jgi:AraC-like DNA-binding protein